MYIEISDQCRIEQGFCLDPEIVSGFSFAFGIGDQSRDDLQNIFLGVNVGEWVKVHTFLKIDRHHTNGITLSPYPDISSHKIYP